MPRLAQRDAGSTASSGGRGMAQHACPQRMSQCAGVSQARTARSRRGIFPHACSVTASCIRSATASRHQQNAKAQQSSVQ